MITLSGKKVVLRDWTDGDLDDVHRLVGDPRVTTWLSFDSRTRDEAQSILSGVLARQDDEPRSEWYLGIVPHGEQRLVGFVRLARDGVRAALLGYALVPEVQNLGYASDAIRTVVAAGMREWDLHRVVALIGPDNSASTRLVKHLGFQYEGTLRDHVFTNGSWRDSEIWSILENEMNNPNNATS